MIVGNPRIFAIESEITIAYEQLSFRALGFFVIHVAGRIYGVREPDASMLACSLDEVERRLSRRGTHTAPFVFDPDAGRIADAVEALYSGEPNDFMGMSEAEFTSALFRRDLHDWEWAPDGDEAFNDGSYVLQFDAGERVRLIAFKFMESEHRHDPSTLSDTWLSADDFYGVLRQWRDGFLSEWVARPKT